MIKLHNERVLHVERRELNKKRVDHNLSFSRTNTSAQTHARPKNNTRTLSSSKCCWWRRCQQTPSARNANDNGETVKKSELRDTRASATNDRGELCAAFVKRKTSSSGARGAHTRAMTETSLFVLPAIIEYDDGAVKPNWFGTSTHI